MKEAYILDENFENTDFTQQFLEKGEYENCTFRNCNFEYSDLSGISFSDCDFIGCNLSMAKLTSTAFRNAFSKNVKCLAYSLMTVMHLGCLLHLMNALFIILFSTKLQ